MDKERRGTVGKEMKLVLLVGVLSMPRKGRRCPSESCMCILADSFSSDTLTSQHTCLSQPGGVVTLVGAVEAVSWCGSSTEWVYSIGMFVQS